MSRGQLLVFEGPDGTGKTTLSMNIAEATAAYRRGYGPPPPFARTWHDAWGVDLFEDRQRGHDRVIHDRGIFGHGIWHQIMPEQNERLLTPVHLLGDIITDIEQHWRLRIVILMRAQRGIAHELRKRGEDVDTALGHALASVPMYHALHRTLVEVGVDAHIVSSGHALRRDPRDWWQGW